MSSLLSYVDFSKSSLQLCLLLITFNPTAWNIVAQNEYRNKTITSFFGGSARWGCYFLAFMIFSLGLVRDSLYQWALADQPKSFILGDQVDTAIATVLFAVGQTLVVSSTWALGITGTFLGDYFGILMDHRVEGFPFNVLNNPMYIGSTLSFAAAAFWYHKPAGLMVTAYVYVVYMIALRFEEPFTDMIYRERAEKKASLKAS